MSSKNVIIKNMKLENILSLLEKAEVKKFVENKVQLEAVKKVVLAAIYFDGTLVPGEGADSQKNFALALASEDGITDQELGSKLRASLAGVQLLENGFAQLGKFQVEEEEKKTKANPAR